MKSLATIAACALIATSAATGTQGAHAESQTVWRLNATTVEKRPEGRQINAFLERLHARSGGQLRIEPYWAGALGIKAEDTLRAMRGGQVEMSTLYGGYFGRDAPDVALALVQGVLLDVNEVEAAIPVLQRIYTEYYRKWNAQVVGWTISPAFQISVFCKEPVRSLEALAGKKLRVWSKDQVETFSRLGVAAQIVPQNDMYVALQTGVIDCALYAVAAAASVSLHEVTRYAAPLHVYGVVPAAIAVSERAWSSIPEALRVQVREAAEETWRAALASIRDTALEDRARAQLTADGKFTLLEGFSQEDRRRFFEAASAVWKEQADRIGRNAPAYRQQVLDAVSAVRAR